MSKRLIALAASLLFLAASAPADEGMWLFNAAPKQRIKDRYGFDLTGRWLDHAMRASVRFNNAGSGAFVSENGLVVTNHHVGTECIQEVSTESDDLMKKGFVAHALNEERKCPDFELNVLQSIEDVTLRIRAAVRDDMQAAEAARARRAAMSAIEAECARNTGLRCDVVTLYAGGLFHLYRYQRYTDVRLVFAPEMQIAFFGGDPENFTFPRYNLDVAFFRVYEDGKPAATPDFFRWSRSGARDGDFVLVTGHPGATKRLDTMAQLDFLREVQYPDRIANLDQRLRNMRAYASQSAENERVTIDVIYSLENSLKAFRGYKAGLDDRKLMDEKRFQEESLRKSLEGKPEYAKAFANIAEAMQIYKEIYLPLTYIERKMGLRGYLTYYARDLVRSAYERGKANEQRLREYRESNLQSLEQQLFAPTTIYPKFEIFRLTEAITEMQAALGPQHPVVVKVLRGRTPAEAAEQFVHGTKLAEVAFRRKLYEGGIAAIEKSDDPLIVLVRSIEPEALELRRRYDNEIEAVVTRDGALVQRARFDQIGTKVYPDATFTLRFSYGTIRGYREDGKNKPAFTTYSGLFKRYEERGPNPPYELPQSWLDARQRLSMKTPANFASTLDIIGGNSGSPVLNRKGELVGLIYDGNMQSLAWLFVYGNELGRAVSVDSRSLIEAGKKIYKADELLDELSSGRNSQVITQPAQ